MTTKDQQDNNEVITGSDLNRTAELAFRKGADALAHADYDKTVKMFGLFDVDAGIAGFVSSAYNVLADWGSGIIGRKAYGLTNQFGPKLGLKGNNLQKVAGAMSIASMVATKTGGFIAPIWQAFSDHYRQEAKLARTLAPVLDELKGSHSYLALRSVHECDNEVIYAHRHRLARIANNSKVNATLDLLVNAGPSMLWDAKLYSGIWKGGHPDAMVAEISKKIAEEKLGNNEAGMGGVARNLTNSLTGPIADRFKQSSEHKLKKSLTAYSTLEMILELEKQLTDKPDARSFTTPGRRGESYSLEEYVMRLMMHHQKEMADISPDHTEIRPALKDDLAAVAGVVAKAIHDGDIAPMELVRLVGEGKLIKNRGRAIADVADVKQLIEKEAPKQEAFIHIDPKEYFDKSPLTKADLKHALDHLKGDEQRLFASMVPIAVLQEAGMSAKEAKAMHEVPLAQHEREMAEILMGRAQQDAEVKKGLLSQREEQQLNKKTEQVETHGVAAVHTLKASATHPEGLENDIVNWAAPQLAEGSKLHLGRVHELGKEELEALEKKRANNNRETANDNKHASKHAQHGDHRAHAEHGNLAHDLG
jgi:hypothetical protein